MNLRHATSTLTAAAVSSRRNRLRAVLAVGAVAAVPVVGLVTATGASAADSSTWNAVASCESTNDWSANTGNGFYGGLQFTPSTWAAYGGTAYASSADQATQGQQIAVAENVLASQGPGAWPVCGPQAGLTAGGTPASTDTTSNSASTTTQDSSSQDTTTSTDTAAPSTDTATPVTTTGGGSYTVQAGDTLGAIAAAHGTTWQDLYAANQTTIGADADTIYPGQTLTIG
ncbi:transglycosylase family protein [Streptacidiphilus sp. N1-3]|uniref:Transglycosylase family protein n=1 Tax=Streptacidiphilus alkalitolerans TaxID=3342712 RepID=A0ABV6X1A2_9ACTN